MADYWDLTEDVDYEVDLQPRRYLVAVDPKVEDEGVGSAMSPILKTEKHDEDEELEFELAYQRTLTTQERFELMFRKSREIAEMLLRHGYRKPVEIVKRT